MKKLLIILFLLMLLPGVAAPKLSVPKTGAGGGCYASAGAMQGCTRSRRSMSGSA